MSRDRAAGPDGIQFAGLAWLFVEDPDKKKALADIYRANATSYLDLPKPVRGDIRDEQMDAVMNSAKFQPEHGKGPGDDDPAARRAPGWRTGRHAGVVLGLDPAGRLEFHAGPA